MIELLSCYMFLPSHAPLVAFGIGSGRWAMWTKSQAEKALRQVVALAGWQLTDYALHSLRIGGATFLAAGGASPEVFRREGLWAGNGYWPLCTKPWRGRHVGLRHPCRLRAWCGDAAKARD